MENYHTIILYYILFIWMVILHTLEEISQDVFNIELKFEKVTRQKYLFGAGMISTLNLGTLALLVSGNQVGLYLGIFTSTVIGVFQALVHTVGFFREGRKAQNFGAGFVGKGKILY